MASSEVNPAPKAGRAPWLYRGLLALSRWVFSRLFVIEVRGREDLPTVSYLLVSNHLHPIDPFILMAVLPDEPRLHFIAKQETVSVWWKRAILGAVGGIIPVSVGSRRSYQEMMSQACAVLQGGGVCGIFPEGHCGSEEGKLLPFRDGLGHLAVRADVPVVPVALSGTSELYLGRRITVNIGEAMPLAQESLALRLQAEIIAERVQRALEAMLTPYQEPEGVVKRWRWLSRLGDRR